MAAYLADIRLLLEGCLGRFARAFVLFATSAVMDLACMAALPLFVALALAGGSPGRPLPGPLASIPAGAFLAAVVGLFVARAALMLVVGSRMAEFAEWVRGRVVLRLMERNLGAGYEDSLARPASGEITAIAHYSITFSLHVVIPLLRLLLDLLTAVVVLAYVASLDPEVVLFAAAVFAVVGLGYFSAIRARTARHSRRLAELQADLNHVATQALSSSREVRVYRLQGYFSSRTAESLQAMTRAQAWLGAVYWFPRALGELTLIGLGILYMVLRSRAGADATLVVSNLSVLAFAGLRLLPAFAQAMTNLGYLQSGRRVTRLLAERLRHAPPAIPSLAPAPHREPFESLELEEVSFRYAGAEADTLSGVSLAIRRGQSVGVVGASGAGKSTLGDVLLGLLPPSGGRVLLNGQDASLAYDRWWSMAGFVPQSPYIANDTLLRNVAYGIADADIDVALVRRSLSLAQLDDVVARLPKGLETPLGDQGVRLSGGQRQRVAIARALYRQRDFLVLDEATSALDAETEREVIGSIEALKGTVTTFIIAHRLSTLRHCDFVIELRDGRVADMRPASAQA